MLTPNTRTLLQRAILCCATPHSSCGCPLEHAARGIHEAPHRGPLPLYQEHERLCRHCSKTKQQTPVFSPFPHCASLNLAFYLFDVSLVPRRACATCFTRTRPSSSRSSTSSPSWSLAVTSSPWIGRTLGGCSVPTPDLQMCVTLMCD